ncbi:helix-turn-helix domain-containing protein, partial [Alteromonas alvinellae]
IEQQAILDICNEERFASLPPSQIVPMLADEGVYLGSESSFYRILKANNQLSHRGKAKPKGTQAKPDGFTATGPCEVWTW